MTKAESQQYYQKNRDTIKSRAIRNYQNTKRVQIKEPFDIRKWDQKKAFEYLGITTF
jgi:hypothetical protein